MQIRSINPATGSTLKVFSTLEGARLESAIAATQGAFAAWSAEALTTRIAILGQVAALLRERRDSLAALMTQEMGKLNQEATTEIDKCAWVCDYYAEQAPGFLAEETIETDAKRSFVAYEPLGTLLAIMPWNFPFWQVFRFAIPNLVAGNTVLLKHASNVPQCALAIDQLLHDAGVPAGVFQTLLISSQDVEPVIAHPGVRGVTLTGSEAAGRQVAALAGRHLKKSVLELGGSDPFIVLADADLDEAVRWGVTSRYMNCGQVCISAKRFIVEEAVADAFMERMQAAVGALVPGDPSLAETGIAPMARADLRRELHKQVEQSRAQGARLTCGGAPLPGAGNFYAPTILDRVTPGMTAFEQELFGPVAAVSRVADAEAALELANSSRFGLGASLWSADLQRAEALARRLEVGSVFINSLVKSDPRLPFGGIKDSGYGRELSCQGVREFCNAKTIWMR